MTQSAVKEMAKESFEQMVNLPFDFHITKKIGLISKDIDRGIRSIQNILSVIIHSVLPSIIEFVIIISFFAYAYDYKFVMIFASIFIVYILFTIYFTNIWVNERKKANLAESNASQKFSDSMMNFSVISYFGKEKTELKEFNSYQEKITNYNLTSQKKHSLLNFGQQFIIASGLTIILWHTTEKVQDGSMTLGDLILINSLLIQLYIPLNLVGLIYKEIKQSFVDLEYFLRLLSINTGFNKKNKQININLTNFFIEFKKLNFSYENKSKKVLNDVDLLIKSGTTVAIIGETGSGKSTIAKLLLNIYKVSPGELFINNLDINEISTKSLRKYIQIVPQDITLFNKSILYNLKYGNPKASYKQIRAICKSLLLDSFINSLPNKYETIVGERGLLLSGGEKQKIAIARALICNPKILILDEATSSLDSNSEKLIQDYLLKTNKNRTTITIAHRLSTITKADNIILLIKGYVQFQGKHRQLLKTSSTYKKMWLQQSEQP